MGYKVLKLCMVLVIVASFSHALPNNAIEQVPSSTSTTAEAVNTTRSEDETDNVAVNSLPGHPYRWPNSPSNRILQRHSGTRELPRGKENARQSMS